MGESHTDDRTRLALVITELEVGGAERCLVNLAIGLDRDRFAPVVYSLAPRPGKERGELVEKLAAAGIDVRFVGATSKWQLFSAARELARLWSEQAPQIVQTFLYHANVVGTLAARRCGVRHIVTSLRVADPRRWRQRLERFVTRRVSKVVCVSESVARFAALKMNYSKEQLVVIPNGVDMSLYPAARAADLRQFGLPEGRRAMVCVGRLERQKGIDWFLTLCPNLFRQFADVDLLLVGEGPERSRLAAQTEALGIVGRVHFAGWRPDVPELLRACDLLVLPSRWEGMPNVLLEAMAGELPVMATQVEGVVELLGPLADEQSALPLEGEKFTARIAAILQYPALAKSLGKRNRARIESNFSLPAMVRAYLRLYDSVVHHS